MQGEQQQQMTTTQNHQSKPSLGLPDIPTSSLDLGVDFSSLLDSSTVRNDPGLSKQASNVVKLAEENERLKKDLEAMSARLEAVERRRIELEKERRQ